MTSIVLRVNSNNLVQHLHLAFTRPTTYLAELMQNARRAGATTVAFYHDPSAKRLIVKDNGSGIGDFQHLLAVAESGWSQDIIENEQPYGIGFLSALFAAKRVTVRSRGREIAFDTAEALAFTPIDIRKTDPCPKTVITLEGVKAFSPEALANYAKGFPIRVFLDGKELPRPHALDSGLPFKQTEIGKCFFTDLTEGVFQDSAQRGTLRFNAYLQGLPILTHNVDYSKSPNIIHLHPSLFHGRLPDRDALVDEERARQRITLIIKETWGNRLAELKRQVEPETFAKHAWKTAVYWDQEHLFNDCPFLPSSTVERALNYPVDFAGGWHFSEPVLDPISQYDIQDKTVNIAAPLDPAYAGEPFQAHMYLLALGGLFLAKNLPDTHWIRPHLIPVDETTITLEVLGNLKTAKYNGDCVWDEKVVFCDKAVLHGPLGPVEISKDAFSFRGGRIKNANALPEEFRKDIIVVPKDETSGIVVRQVCSFMDEDDCFNEEHAIEEVDLFSRFILANRPASELALLRDILRSANLHEYSSLRGKTFQVTVPSHDSWRECQALDIHIIDSPRAKSTRKAKTPKTRRG